MQLRVSPTRMMLLQLQRRLSLAQRGHKLLKDKLDGLVQRFLTIKKNYLELYQELEPQLVLVFKKTVFAHALSSPSLFQKEILAPPLLKLSLSSTNLMGVRIPSYLLEIEGKPNIPPLLTTVEYQEALNKFFELLPKLIQLSALNRSLRLVASEIIQTRRRVNALEYILLPELERNIRLIRMKLSELERASKVVLLKM